MSDDPKKRWLDEEIRKALREGDDVLPPGFHARARERFLKRRRTRGLAGLRILSWETAGLAAAVMLAAALFLPDLMQRDALDPSPARPEGTGSTAVGGRDEAFALDEAAGELSDLAPTEEPAFAPVPQPPRAPARSKVKKVVEKTAPADPVADAPALRERRSAKTRVEQVAGVAAQKREDDLDAEPRPAPAQSLPSPATATEGGFAPSTLRPEVVELPAGIAAPGAHGVDRRAEWEALLEGPAGTQLRRLGDPDPALRLVLLGVETIDCSTVAVFAEPDGYRIRFHAPPTGEAGSSGCAFTLPRDGQPLRLDPVAGP